MKRTSKAVAVLKEFVDRAYFLKAEKLLICSGRSRTRREEKAKRQLVKSLNELLIMRRRFRATTSWN